MKIGKQWQERVANQFAGALDCLERFDRAPFYLKREAAEAAAKVALEHLEKNMWRHVPYKGI